MISVETVFRRERTIVGGCLAALVALAWLYLLWLPTGMPGMRAGGADMAGMAGMDMPGMDMAGMTGAWTATDLTVLFVMWAVMMVAMMVPSAAPMTLAFLAINQRRRAAARAIVPTGMFLLGYVLAWTVFSASATLAQWGLHEAALLSPAMAATSPLVTGGLLVAAGVFQWTPLKRTCLTGCRSPLSFLMTGWREGPAGALTMGLRHGVYCVGCCSVLMALLFVTGVMNLLWVAVIAAFVLAEKALARGELVGRLAGMTLVALGMAHLIGGS